MQRGPLVLGSVLLVLALLAGSLYFWNPGESSQESTVLSDEEQVTLTALELCSRAADDYEIIAEVFINEDVAACQNADNLQFCRAVADKNAAACGGNPACEAIAARDRAACGDNEIEQPFCEAVIDGTDVFSAVAVCEQNVRRLIAEEFAFVRECEKISNRDNPKCRTIGEPE